MSATAAFKTLWRSGQRQLAVLARVGMRDPFTLATTFIRGASAAADTPAGATMESSYWPNTLKSMSPVNAPGALAETSVRLCSTTLKFEANALPSYLLLEGASVEVWLWDERLATFDDALMIFKGEVLSWSQDTTLMTLECRQRVNWNRDITPVEVTTQAYPMAPEDSIGQRVPIVYGRLRDIPFRFPWAEYPQAEDVTSGTVIRGSSLIFGGRRAGAAIIVDTGRGAGAANNPAAKVLCASHKVSRIGDHKTGTGFFLDAGADRLVALEVITPGTDIFNTVTEAGILIRDDESIAWASALPTGVADFSGSAENIRAVLDPWNDNNYCRLDWTAGFKFCHMHFPALPQELGVMTELYLFVSYKSPTSTNLTLRLYRDASPTAATDFAIPTTATRKVRMFRVATAWGTGLIGNHIPVSPYAFSETNMEFGWSNFPSLITGTGAAELYCAGWLVRFVPGQSVVQSERIITKTGTRPVTSPRSGKTVFMPYTVEETLPPVTELRGKFFANVDGWPDDGSGSYAAETLTIDWGTAVVGQFTVSFADASQLMKDRLLRVSVGDLVTTATGGPSAGSTVSGYNPATFVLSVSLPNTSTGPVHGATLGIKLRNALLERAPDILAHMLVNYGGEALANVEQGVGSFASFVDARVRLKNPQNRDMTYAFSVDKTTDVMTAISWLAQGSLSFVFLDRFTDKWRITPWRTDSPVDYDWTFRPKDIIEKVGPSLTRTPLSSIMSGVQVTYSYSGITKESLHKNRLAWDGSSAGQKYRGIRDGYITVDATNNKLSWQLSGVGSVNATLTNGTYDVLGFATMVNAVMKAADAARDYIVVNGATIIPGYNDQLFYHDTSNAVDRTVTFDPGTYTFEGLCAHVAAKMDAANGVDPMNITYSRSTRKTTFERRGAAVAAFFTMYRTTAPLRSRRFLATMGFDQTAAAVTSNGTCNVTSAYERDDEFFIVGNNTLAMNLNWELGASGINGTRTDCHALLGFEGIRDSVGIGLSVPATCLLADAPKCVLEAQLTKTAQRYGARRDTVLDARAVQESETARELRNRVGALIGKPRVILNFSTEMAPDLERTRVIQFSGDFDAILPYPDPDTDGSWVGKRFVVVETEQQVGPVAFYTKVTAVSLD